MRVVHEFACCSSALLTLNVLSLFCPVAPPNSLALETLVTTSGIIWITLSGSRNVGTSGFASSRARILMCGSWQHQTGTSLKRTSRRASDGLQVGASLCGNMCHVVHLARSRPRTSTVSLTRDNSSHSRRVSLGPTSHLTSSHVDPTSMLLSAHSLVVWIC